MPGPGDARGARPWDAAAVAAAVPMARAIAAVERALVDHALGHAHGRRGEQVAFASGGALWDLAAAAAGAIASRFLAVGTPRSIGLVDGGPVAGDAARAAARAELCLAAHAAYFAPREVRRGDARAACAADIVCVVDGARLEPAWLRAGTHVNLLDGALDLAALPRAVVADLDTLAAMVAGKIDGRQLDELTIFAPRDLALCEHAIARAAAAG